MQGETWRCVAIAIALGLAAGALARVVAPSDVAYREGCDCRACVGKRRADLREQVIRLTLEGRGGIDPALGAASPID